MSIWAAVLAPAMTSADRQTSGSEKRSRGNPRPPRAVGFPKGRAFPSLTCRAGPPTIPRRRQEVCASADRPAEAFFLFGPCNRAAVGGSAALRMRHTPCGYGPFLFWQDQKRNGGCITQPSSWLIPPSGSDGFFYPLRQKYGPQSASWVWTYVQVNSLSTTYQSSPGMAPASADRASSSSPVTGRTRGSPSGGYSK